MKRYNSSRNLNLLESISSKYSTSDGSNLQIANTRKDVYGYISQEWFIINLVESFVWYPLVRQSEMQRLLQCLELSLTITISELR